MCAASAPNTETFCRRRSISVAYRMLVWIPASGGATHSTLWYRPAKSSFCSTPHMTEPFIHTLYRYYSGLAGVSMPRQNVIHAISLRRTHSATLTDLHLWLVNTPEYVSPPPSIPPQQAGLQLHSRGMGGASLPGSPSSKGHDRHPTTTNNSIGVGSSSLGRIG